MTLSLSHARIHKLFFKVYFIYLKDRVQKEGKRERASIHCTNGLSGWGWARLERGGKNFIRVSHWDAGAQAAEEPSAVFPGTLSVI